MDLGRVGRGSEYDQTMYEILKEIINDFLKKYSRDNSSCVVSKNFYIFLKISVLKYSSLPL